MRRLDGIDAKLDRAQKHLDGLDEEWKPWAAGKEAWEFSGEINERKRRYIVSIRLRKPLTPVFSLIGGEIVHHARSSLDHLACYLVEASGGQVTNSTAWPVVRSRGEWARKVERRKRRIQFWRKKGGGPLAGASDEVRAFIKSKQPYRRRGKARDDPLFRLEELWNTEKHRILYAGAVFANPPGSWRELFRVEPDIEPVEFKWIIDPNRELESEAKLALIRFPLNQPLPRVKMDGQLPVQIAIGEGKGKTGGGGIQESLDLVREIVREAGERFPP